MTVPPLLHPFSRPAATRDRFVTIVAGEGAEVVDDQGRRYVDALASLWYCNAGHGRREIIEAIGAQLASLACFHTFERFSNPPAERLAAELTRLAPFSEARAFLTSSGSEAVDSALKLARIAHFLAGDRERTLVVSRRPSYHGVTYGALTATGLPQNQEGFGPLVGHALQVPYDDLDSLDEVLASHGDQVAAVLAEPVVGAGGVLPPPAGYLEGLRERCDSYGTFLIADEVICGFGRLGHWWGMERYGVVPDLVTFAKGVTSGYQPLGGVLLGAAVRRRLEADPEFVLRHGHTYSGHPAGCAAALANLEVLRDEGLVDRGGPLGDRLAGALSQAVDGKRVVEIRGEGAMRAAVLAPGIAAVAVRDAMLDRGVIARFLGESVMAFCPPLVIDDAALDRCGEALAAAVRAVAP